MATGRATVITAAAPLRDEGAGRAWLRGAGEAELTADLAVLEWMLDAYRIAAGDPYLPAVGRAHLLVARIGFGDGEQVAHGRWSDARELLPARGRSLRLLDPTTRMVAILGGRDQVLACEELALRARLDVDAGRWRVAALQLQAALTAAVAELGGATRDDASAVEPGAAAPGEGAAGTVRVPGRIAELAERLAQVDAIAAAPPRRRAAGERAGDASNRACACSRARCAPRRAG